MTDHMQKLAPSTTDSLTNDAFEVHRQMVITLFGTTLFFGLLLLVGLLCGFLTALMVVAVAGAMGGFVSALRRLYTFQWVIPIDFLKIRHKWDLYLIIYSMIPSLIGAIAAVTLYLFFASGLVNGYIFPKFHLDTTNYFQKFISFILSCLNSKSNNNFFQKIYNFIVSHLNGPPLPNAFYNFVYNWAPATPSDYAKAIVWGFIAGFSEKFVPDLLEHFASAKQIAAGGKATIPTNQQGAPANDVKIS